MTQENQKQFNTWILSALLIVTSIIGTMLNLRLDAIEKNQEKFEKRMLLFREEQVVNTERIKAHDRSIRDQ